MRDDVLYIDGVHQIDGSWEAWLGGRMVAAGPTKEIIEAAYEHHKPRMVPTEPETWAVHPQSGLLDLLPEGTDWKIPNELRHERLTTEELHTVQRLHDAITGSGTAENYRHYMDDVIAPKFRLPDVGTPIYDALVAEGGRTMVHESDGKVCTHPRVSLWCAWTMSMVVPS